jgi:hypothetical protein
MTFSFPRIVSGKKPNYFLLMPSLTRIHSCHSYAYWLGLISIITFSFQIIIILEEHKEHYRASLLNVNYTQSYQGITYSCDIY